MATQWIEVIDTAIKIGLGSLITGGATYLVSRHTHVQQRQRFLLEHRLKILERASENLDQYFDAWGQLAALAAGTSRTQEELKRPLNKLEAHQISSLREKDAIIGEAMKARNAAVSRLRLLRASQLDAALRLTLPALKKLRDAVIFEARVFPYEEAKAMNEEISVLKEKVHSELANLFDRVCT
jgi:hypothetical protein